MNKSTRVIIAAAAWVFILLVGVGVYRLFLAPRQEAAKQQAEAAKHEQTIAQTGSSTRYSTQINFAYDSFSGYCVFRTQQFSDVLGTKKIKANGLDDGADYRSRLAKLKSGELDIALFPVDALIKASADMGDMPATIFALVDETRGGDAMVAFKTAIPNLDALNSPNVKFVLTPDSPSETLSRVVMSHFGLKNLSSDPFTRAKDADDVYRLYRNSKPEDPQAFVLWEPYVTKMLENPNTHVLVDSSRFRGYIVDALVVNRNYLLNNENNVVDFLEAYLTAFYSFAQEKDKIVAEDAQKSGQPLNAKQLERLTAGIWWKNTSENYSHFGLSNGQSLQHVEDMITNITQVLKSTGAISSDPTGGQPNRLYYDKILSRLQQNNFHPGITPESLRKDGEELPVLTEEQWGKLIPVGTLDVPTIVFARGTSALTDQSQSVLNELIDKLKSWPQYYVIIRGNASLKGDIEANKKLAMDRSKSVEEYLYAHGIGKSRVKAVTVEPTGSTEVVFQLGYTSY